MRRALVRITMAALVMVSAVLVSAAPALASTHHSSSKDRSEDRAEAFFASSSYCTVFPTDCANFFRQEDRGEGHTADS